MSDVAWICASVAALVASGGIVARCTPWPHVQLIGLLLMLTGWAGLLAAIVPASQRDRWPFLVCAAIAAVGLAWWLAGVLRGREQWILGVGAAVVSLRVPVPTGDGASMLLGPLYLVIGVAALHLVRSEISPHALTSGLRPSRASVALDVAIAAIPVVAALSLLWSFDRTASTEALAFFLIPFSIAYVVVRGWVRSGVSLRPAAYGLVGFALVAAAVGLVQAATRQVWWNPKVIDANRFRADFRTNSVFWDPNIYGRALVVAVLALVAWLLVAQVRRRHHAAAVVGCVVLVAALWCTYSQSSWVAMSAALVLIAVLTLPPRARRWAAAALTVLVLAGLPLAMHQLSGSDVDGRERVIRTGFALAKDKPAVGWGVGTFEQAAEARSRDRGERVPGLIASHTTPVTVLVELGGVGFAAYLALLCSTAVAMLVRWRRSSTPASAARASMADSDATGWPSSDVIWASGAVVAILAHSLLYAGFFEDATTWVAVAILASATTPRVNRVS